MVALVGLRRRRHGRHGRLRRGLPPSPACWPRRRGRRCWPRRARPPLLAMRHASAVHPELGLPESCPLPGGVGAPLCGRAPAWRPCGVMAEQRPRLRNSLLDGSAGATAAVAGSARGAATPPFRPWRFGGGGSASSHGGPAAAARAEIRRGPLSPFLLRRGGPLSLRSSSLPAASVRRSTARHEPPACHAPPPPCRAAPRLCLQPVPRLRLRPARPPLPCSSPRARLASVLRGLRLECL